jgi:predicted amidohydrolase
MSYTITPYKALALQTTCFAINRCKNRGEADEKNRQTLQRLAAQIRASKAFIGQDLKLVVLPEYFLTGFPMGESIETWREKACFDKNGWEYEAFSKIAADNQIYLSGNVYETDEHFPDLYFQTSFIINTEGVLVLRYRRLNSMFAPTPHDVWDKYLDIYGLEGVFPVAKTAIGNLACIASEEILYPEIARCMAVRGAEVFLHASSEVSSPLFTQKNIAKQARAIENMAYLVSANSAGIADIDIPFASTDSSSKIINYEGIPLCEAATGESMVANATIDIQALRYHRQRPGMSNFLSRQRFDLYAETYKNTTLYPANTLLDKKAERSHFVSTQKKVIENLRDLGII